MTVLDQTPANHLIDRIVDGPGGFSGVDGDGTSPFDHLEGAGAPALIVHGTHDVVASPDAAALLAGALAGTGRPPRLRPVPAGAARRRQVLRCRR